MSGVILDPVTSPEAIMANLQRLNEALTALQGGSIALSQIVGYEDLVTETDMGNELTTLRQEVDRLKIPVGGRYYSSTATNPAEFFGYGTWVLVGAGRVDMGHGSASDTRGESRTFSAGETGGEFAHIQTEAEMAPHKHYFTHGQFQGGHGVYGSWASVNYLNRTEETQVSGSGQPFNIMQPYEVIYKWQRTA